MTTSTKVNKWGNSLGIRLPKRALETMGILEGANVTIAIEGKSLVVTPVEEKFPTLTEMLKDFDVSDQELLLPVEHDSNEMSDWVWQE